MSEHVDALQGKHRGRTIFVLGTSGSMKHMNLSRLRGHITIGVNHALEEWEVNYLLMVDTKPLDHMAELLGSRPEVTLLLTSRLAEHATDDLELPCPIYTFRVKPGDRINPKGDLQQVDNTSHYAVEVAHRMRGYTPGRIVLLGIDLRYPTEEERAAGADDHVWGKGSDRGCKENFGKPIAVYPQTAAELRRRGTTLTTCSPWSGPLTDCLDRRDFDELMDELDGERMLS